MLTKFLSESRTIWNVAGGSSRSCWIWKRISHDVSKKYKNKEIKFLLLN